MSIDISFTLTEDEIAEALRASYTAKNARAFRRLRIIVPALLIPTLILAAVVTMKWGLSIWRITRTPAWLLAIVVAVLVFSWVVHRTTFRTIARQLARSPAFSSPHAVHIDEHCVKYSQAIGTSENLWATFVSYCESRDFFLLFYSPITIAVVLPKRAFSSPDELNSFRALLAEKIGCVFPKVKAA